MKLTMMGFVFSFVFLIGMGNLLVVFNDLGKWWINLIITTIACLGYYYIIKLTQDLDIEHN